MSEARRPRRSRKAGASLPSPAALGVVRVADDFSIEYPDGDPLAAEVFATLIRTGEAAAREVDRAMLASYGVGQPVLNALAVVEGDEQMLTPTEVSERTLTSSATVTSTLDILEYNGWVRRVPNPDDRRSVLIEITDEGRALANQFLPGIRALEQAVLVELSRSERATLLKLLGKVLHGAATVAEADPIPLKGRRNRPRRLV